MSNFSRMRTDLHPTEQQKLKVLNYMKQSGIASRDDLHRRFPDITYIQLSKILAGFKKIGLMREDKVDQQKYIKEIEVKNTRENIPSSMKKNDGSHPTDLPENWRPE